LLSPRTSLARAFGIPKCQTCEGCPLRAQCYYDAQRTLFAQLQARASAAEIDQTELRAVFADASDRDVVAA
jgi:hypothetical protein